MKNPRTAAALITVAMAVFLVVLLLLVRLSVNAEEWPPKPKAPTALVEVEEEFVEFFDLVPVSADPAPAYAAQAVSNQSSPAKADGADMTDAGEAAAPTPDVVSERPSPIERPKKEKPQKTGPDKRLSILKRLAEKHDRAYRTHLRLQKKEPTTPPLKVMPKVTAANPMALHPMSTVPEPARWAEVGLCRAILKFRHCRRAALNCVPLSTAKVVWCR